MAKHDKNPWAMRILESYLRLCEQRGVEQPHRLAQGHLGFTVSQWGDFRAGETIFKDTRLYARLFFLGVQEADPRTIPPRRQNMPQLEEGYKDIPRAWTEDEWQAWLTTDEAKSIAHLFPSSPSADDNWAANLARGIRELCSSLEWTDLDDLRGKLGLDNDDWVVILKGAEIIDAPDDDNPYARLYFGLGIGDPRTLPQKDVTDQEGRFIRQRRWTEDRLILWENRMGMGDVRNDRQWLEWWNLNRRRIIASVMAAAKPSTPVISTAQVPIQPSEAPISLPLVADSTSLDGQSQLTGEVAMLPPVPTEQPAAFSFEATLGMLGSFIDRVVQQQADQTTRIVGAQRELKDALVEVKTHVTTQADETRREFMRLMQEQLDGIIEQVRAEILQDLEPLRQQIRELAEQKAYKPDTNQLATILQGMSEKLDDLIISTHVRVPDKSVPAPRQQKRGDRMQEIASLTRQLTALLREYWGAAEQDRDQLVQRHGRELGGLFAILDPLTLSPEQREKSIRLGKEFNS